MKNKVYLKGNTKGITVQDIVKTTTVVSLEQKIQPLFNELPTLNKMWHLTLQQKATVKRAVDPKLIVQVAVFSFMNSITLASQCFPCLSFLVGKYSDDSSNTASVTDLWSSTREKTRNCIFKRVFKTLIAGGP